MSFVWLQEFRKNGTMMYEVIQTAVSIRGQCGTPRRRARRLVVASIDLRKNALM